MDEKENCLEELKENYLVLKEKYSLPDFDELNRDFQIEKVAGLETDFLVREIARIVSEKLSDFLRFLEGILNPVNGSMLVFSILKTLGEEEKKILTEIYKEIARTEIKMMRLGLEFDEEGEAKFILNSYCVWQKVKKEMSGILDVIDSNWEKDFRINGKDKCYFN
jgi:hypothetical protein